MKPGHGLHEVGRRDVGVPGRYGRRLAAIEPWLEEQRSEDRLRAVIESSPLAIMEVDLETRVIRWNRAAEHIFGWTRDEMLGRPATQMVPPSKQAEADDLIARNRAGESYTGYQTIRQRKDGTLIEVMMAGAPVRDANGHMVSHVVVYEDISERKQQEERLQALIDSSPLALVEFGLDTRIRLWNPAAERIFGWSAVEMLDRGGLPMAPASHRAEAEELFVRVRDGESINDYETVRQRKDGTPVAVSIAAAPVSDGAGHVVGNMVAYTDITERKAQEERLQALIDSSPLALVEFGLDTGIRLWNPAAQRIFGWSREEMLGRPGLPLASPTDHAESEELFARVLAGESINDHETVRQRKDGTPVAVSIAAAPVRDASGRVVSNMVAYTDITERKAQEAEVHRLNAELHARLEELAASRARIVTAGDVERRRLERNLHDGAQQRLVTLSLSLRLALAKLDSDPAAARAALAEAGDELSLALEELRELARGLHPAVLSDRGLRAAVEMLAGRAPLPVEIEAIPAERLPAPVEAAAYYLIAEALTNVAKYANASTVRVRVTTSDASLFVEVSDDGIGGADPASGSGLRGLADRVEALGGSLEVVSPAGVGTSL
jgi:PAS domain S-box-containing protein